MVLTVGQSAMSVRNNVALTTATDVREAIKQNIATHLKIH